MPEYDAFTFKFTGRHVPLRFQDEKSEMDDRIQVDELNHIGREIEVEIAASLRSTLPPGVDVRVQIEFRPGSIEWEGVVWILDWMARLSGSVALLEYFTRAIRLSVSREIRGRLRSGGTTNTDVSLLGKPSKAFLFNWNTITKNGSVATILAFVNCILLAAILYVLLHSKAPPLL